MAFKRQKRYSVFAHLLLHIHPRRKNTLADGVRALVQHMVKYLHAEVRHSDLIHIGKTESKTH